MLAILGLLLPVSAGPVATASPEGARVPAAQSVRVTHQTRVQRVRDARNVLEGFRVREAPRQQEVKRLQDSEEERCAITIIQRDFFQGLEVQRVQEAIGRREAQRVYDEKLAENEQRVHDRKRVHEAAHARFTAAIDAFSRQHKRPRTQAESVPTSALPEPEYAVEAEVGVGLPVVDVLERDAELRLETSRRFTQAVAAAETAPVAVAQELERDAELRRETVRRFVRAVAAAEAAPVAVASVAMAHATTAARELMLLSGYPLPGQACAVLKLARDDAAAARGHIPVSVLANCTLSARCALLAATAGAGTVIAGQPRISNGLAASKAWFQSNWVVLLSCQRNFLTCAADDAQWKALLRMYIKRDEEETEALRSGTGVSTVQHHGHKIQYKEAVSGKALTPEEFEHRYCAMLSAAAAERRRQQAWSPAAIQANAEAAEGSRRDMLTQEPENVVEAEVGLGVSVVELLVVEVPKVAAVMPVVKAPESETMLPTDDSDSDSDVEAPPVVPLVNQPTYVETLLEDMNALLQGVRDDKKEIQKQFSEQQALQATELSEIKNMMSAFLHEWRVKNGFNWMPREYDGNRYALPPSKMPPPKGYKQYVALPR